MKLELKSLVISIPLASLNLSTILSGSAFLIFVFTVSLFDSSIQILGGLFQIPLLKIPIMFSLCISEKMGSFSLDEPYIFLFSLIPIVYTNADSDKDKVLADNKNKAGIYQWIHLESGKRYVGSAVDLTKRFRCYYSKTYLTRSSKSYINNALIKFGYSAFSLTIIEHINISDLSLEQARNLILSREQYYIDSFKPEYNINPIAGSRLGPAQAGETKSLMSRPISDKTKALISLAMSGENHHQWGKTGENSQNFGKIHSSEARNKMSAIKGGGTIYVYSEDHTLEKTYCSAREAAKHLNCSYPTILKYAKSRQLFKEQWILSLTTYDK
jgi:group I intron endonuclease